MTAVRVIIQIIIVAGIITGAVLGTRALIALRQPPPSREPSPYLPAVRVRPLHPAAGAVELTFNGEVTARFVSQLNAEVTGQVRWIAPQLEAGVGISAGDELLRLEERDHRLALAQAEAQLAEASRLLAEEEARGHRAAREWHQVGQGAAGDLVLRRPQLAAAQAQLAAAQTQLSAAEQRLAACRIRAPHDALVVARDAELGQWVTPGAPLARLQATDAVDVLVAVPESDLVHLELSPGETLPAEVANGNRRWSAQVIRSLGRIDPRNRTLSLVVRITRDDNDDLPLVGSFVQVHLTGRHHDRLLVLDDALLRDGSHLWLFEADEDRHGRLRQRTVEILHRRPGILWLTTEVADGSLAIIDPLPGAYDGMPVILAEDDLPPASNEDQP